MSIIKYLVIIAIAAAGFYFLLNHFILGTSPWKEFDGTECDTSGNCTTHECRQQNNYWTSQAIDQANRKICNKAMECLDGESKTTVFDEIELCQVSFNQAGN